MTMLEFIYNVICFAAIIDLIISYINISKYAVVIMMAGLSNITQLKLLVEKIIIITYIAYWIYKLYIFYVQ